MDNYKQFSQQALAIYNLMLQFIDKYGIMGVDWMGYILNLNKNGKPISKQNADELFENFKELNTVLQNPEAKALIIETIKEMEPILKEGLYSMLSVASSGFEFIIKDGITFICSDTPLAPVCGIFKFAENGIEFGQELLNGARGNLHTVNDLKDTSANLQQKMDTMNQSIPNTQNMYQQGGKKIKFSLKGGARTLKRLSREKKKIEKRIHHSMNEFLNVKTNKTRKR